MAAQARERGYDALAEQSLLVAQGIADYSTGDINRDKLIVDTRLKLLAKWSKRYADKQQLEVNHTGGVDFNVMLPATTAFIQALLNPPTMDSAALLTIDNVPVVDDII